MGGQGESFDLATGYGIGENSVATLGVEVLGPSCAGFETVLTPLALEFVASLARRFGDRRDELLARRAERQKKIDAGEMPDFLPETAEVRGSDWTVAPVPPPLQDRRVEITGPVDRKMIINGLNSGASVFMADFEDSNAPTWENCVQGQLNLFDAVRGTIGYVSPEGKRYALREETATLVVRPRGWHLDERHVRVDGRPVPAALFDFGLFFFHNAKEQLARGFGPYFYLPKMENRLEARLWNDVFLFAQSTLGIAKGTIKATVLIEHVLAAFEMDEILFELRDHAAGLNCGRWDYIFSVIKTFRNRRDLVLGVRANVTMTTHFLRSYSLLLIDTCHRRGAHAMGGMAAQIPIAGDPAANALALAKVRADKEREAGDGHDGTWVAHPALVPLAREVFDRHMPGPNQLHRRVAGPLATAKDLLLVPDGSITGEGVRTNVEVSLHYLEAWLRGKGCVPIRNLMEDAATVEISRAQLWQWVRHGAKLSDGRRIDASYVRGRIRAALDAARAGNASPRLELAAKLFEEIALEPEFPAFLTLRAYEHI
ncbi:MAG: malate synthase A [Planctomycetota bacterium]